MKLAYDPGEGPSFWQAIEKLPGYPAGVVMPISFMLFESDAVYRLPALFEQVQADLKKPLLVVMDKTYMNRKGRDLKQLVIQILTVAGWQVNPVVLEPDATGQIHTDMTQIDTVKANISQGCSLLALGSGTVCDITKHAGYLYERETGTQLKFIVFQTANSVSAFTSNMAPTFINGVKRTLPSRYPDALVCDLETLSDAPYDMTVAGVGDLLAAFVSLPDWYLANQLGLDTTYNEFAQCLMGPLDDIFEAWAKSIHDRSAEGMSVLAKLIALGGLAMSLSHTTTPMSGYEHVMSHILDLLAETTHKHLAQHGTQVALATLLATDAYRLFLDEFDPNEVDAAVCYPTEIQMKQKIRRVFMQIDPTGRAGEECWADYRIKLEGWGAQRGSFEKFIKEWPSVQFMLSGLTRNPERLLKIMQAIDSPLTFRELVPPVTEAQARFAFMNSPLMRKRFTLGDLLIFLNWDRDRLWRRVWAGTQKLPKG